MWDVRASCLYMGVPHLTFLSSMASNPLHLRAIEISLSHDTSYQVFDLGQANSGSEQAVSFATCLVTQAHVYASAAPLMTVHGKTGKNNIKYHCGSMHKRNNTHTLSTPGMSDRPTVPDHKLSTLGIYNSFLATDSVTNFGGKFKLDMLAVS